MRNRLAMAIVALLIAVAPLKISLADWRKSDIVDDWGEKTGRYAVVSDDVTLGDDWMMRQHSCRFIVYSGSSSAIHCTYLNLVGGSFGESYQLHRIPVRVGERVRMSLDGKERHDGQGYVQFDNRQTRQLLDAIKGELESGLMMIRLNYYEEGAVVLRFPLKGLKDMLRGAGFDGE